MRDSEFAAAQIEWQIIRLGTKKISYNDTQYSVSQYSPPLNFNN